MESSWLFFILLTVCYLTGKSNNLNLYGHFDISMSEFESTSCTILNKDVGVLFYEAFRFAVKSINEKPDSVHGRKFNALFLDTCHDTKMNPYFTMLYQGLAVIGPYSSEISEFTARFLTPFRLPTISFGASSGKLSNREKFPEFFRTVPEDKYAALTYVSLARKFNWNYVGIMYTNNEDGTSLMSEFQNRMMVARKCIAVIEGIKNDAPANKYREGIQQVLQHKTVKVVFLFLSMKGCNAFFTVAQEFQEQLKKLQLVIGTGCSTMVQVPPLFESTFRGMITVQISDPFPYDFQEYFSSLTPENNKANGYFSDYWELVYNCTLRNVSADNYCHHRNNTVFNRWAPVRPIIEAVQFLTISCYEAFNIMCAEDKNPAKCYASNEPRKINKLRRIISEKLLYVNNTNNGKLQKFTKFGSLMSDFDVLQYQSDTATGLYTFVKVGLWNFTKYKSGEQPLLLSPSLNLTDSVCSQPCKKKEIKEFVDYYGLLGCCWKCKPCASERTMIIVNNTCKSCSLGEKANDEQTKCLTLPILSITAESPLSIVVVVFSCLTLIPIMIICAVYLHNYSTPLIKATSRELALFSLAGLALMLITPLFYIQRPTPVICAAQKLMFGLSLTCCYAPLVLKTNRIYRIFVSSHKFKLRQLMLVSMTSQFMLIGGMVGIQLLMAIFWILTDRPMVYSQYPIDEDYVITSCTFTITSGALNIIFPAALMVASTFWAFKTRNLPETFSEIKSIGVTMYVTLFFSTCALALTVIIGSVFLFVQTYVLCFTFQVIVAVTLIGQYAKKVKLIYLADNFDPNPSRENQTEISTIRNNFTSPSNSPNLNGRATHKEQYKTQSSLFVADKSFMKNSFTSMRTPGSPRVKRFSIDLS